MSKTMYEFTRSPVVTNLEVSQSRDHSDRTVTISILQGSDRVTLRLTNPNDIDNLFGILDAQQIWIEDEGDSQREFGRYKIGYSDEAYTELWVDSLTEENK